MTTNNIKFLAKKIEVMESELTTVKNTLNYMVDLHLEMLTESIQDVCRGGTSKINEGINSLIDDACVTFKRFPQHLDKFRDEVFKEFLIQDEKGNWFIDLSDDSTNQFIAKQIKQFEKDNKVKIDLSRTYDSQFRR